MMKYQKPEMEIVRIESVFTAFEDSMLYQDPNQDPTTDIGGDYSGIGSGGGSMGDYMN